VISWRAEVSSSAADGATGHRQAKPALQKWLRVTTGTRLRIDRAAIRAEEHLDGKYLLRTSDPTLSAEDVALGYKQVL
jgi:hypothetical protein